MLQGSVMSLPLSLFLRYMARSLKGLPRVLASLGASPAPLPYQLWGGPSSQQLLFTLARALPCAHILLGRALGPLQSGSRFRGGALLLGLLYELEDG